MRNLSRDEHTGRTRNHLKTTDHGKTQRRALGISQQHAIATFALRAPARLLLQDVYADLLRVLHSTGNLDDVGGNFPELDAPDQEDSFDSMDVEGVEDDWEGDATESDERYSLFDQLFDRTDRSHEEPADVIVETIALDNGEQSVFVRSGIAHLLLRYARQGGMENVYHEALRKRIDLTLSIARQMIHANAAFLAETAPSPIRLRREEVRTSEQAKNGQKLSEETFSHLMAQTTLQMPSGERRPLSDFLETYSASESTEGVLVQVLAEQHSTERQQALSAERAGRKALTDAQLTAYVNQVLLQRHMEPVTLGAIRAARADRLGLPDSSRRAAEYAQERSLITMLLPGQSPQERWRKWQRLLEPLQTHPNAQTRGMARVWLADIKVLLAGQDIT